MARECNLQMMKHFALLSCENLAYQLREEHQNAQLRDVKYKREIFNETNIFDEQNKRKY